MRFCLQLGSRSHIEINNLEQLSWLPVSKIFEQCNCSNAIKCFNKACHL